MSTPAAVARSTRGRGIASSPGALPVHKPGSQNRVMYSLGGRKRGLLLYHANWCSICVSIIKGQVSYINQLAAR